MRSPGRAIRDRDAIAVVIRALRNPAGPPPDWSCADVPGIVATASGHRVLPLLGWLLRAEGALAQWPDQFIDNFRRAEREAVFVDCVRQVELAKVLHDVNSAGVQAILFKGAALASHITQLRTCASGAIPISSCPRMHCRTLEGVLGRLGYLQPAEMSGDLVSYQGHYHKT